MDRRRARDLNEWRACEIVRQCAARGTIVEGEWPEVMAVVDACFQAMKADCSRISTSIRIDYRAGPGGRLKGKVDSIERKLGRKLST